MKNLFLSLFLVAGFVALGQAEGQRGTPRAVTGESIHTPGFAGVSIATSAFSVLTTTVTYSTETVRGTYSVFGVNFSSGPCFSHVDLFDSTNTLNSQDVTGGTLRVYNVIGSTGTSGAPSGVCAGFSPIGEPVKFTEGLLFKPASAAFNKIGVLYYKEGE